MASIHYPLCDGHECPRRLTCGRFSDVIHEDDIAFTHAPWDKRKKSCEFYFGLEEGALSEYVKTILNGHDKNS